MQHPKHDLEKVKDICNKYLNGIRNLVAFTAPTRSINCVVKVLQCSQEEAAKVIMKGILRLGPDDFAHRKLQWDEVFDVYGLLDYENENWYVKLMICSEDGEEILEEVSFHIPEKEDVLVDGRILKERGKT